MTLAILATGVPFGIVLTCIEAELDLVESYTFTDILETLSIIPVVSVMPIELPVVRAGKVRAH